MVECIRVIQVLADAQHTNNLAGISKKGPWIKPGQGPQSPFIMSNLCMLKGDFQGFKH